MSLGANLPASKFYPMSKMRSNVRTRESSDSEGSVGFQFLMDGWTLYHL